MLDGDRLLITGAGSSTVMIAVAVSLLALSVTVTVTVFGVGGTAGGVYTPVLLMLPVAPVGPDRLQLNVVEGCDNPVSDAVKVCVFGFAPARTWTVAGLNLMAGVAVVA